VVVLAVVLELVLELVRVLALAQVPVQHRQQATGLT